MPFFQELFIISMALLIDVSFGEYPNRFHPVAWMGRSVRKFTKLIPDSPSPAYLWGFVVALGFPFLWASGSSIILWSVDSVDWLYLILAVLILKSSFALSALGYASTKVSKLLQEGQVEKARFELRSLCSRDASELSEKDLLSASISSVAENLCDSVVAPLFYYFLFGIPGAIAYRMINTLDAMLGYMDERRWLGHFSAKLDDLVNYIPSRLTAWLLILASWIKGSDHHHGIRIMIRDHFSTPSPNGGWPMAAMAGLLRIQIEKKGSYSLGDPVEDISFQKMEQSWSLTYLAGLLSFGLLILCLGVKYAFS